MLELRPGAWGGVQQSGRGSRPSVGRLWEAQLGCARPELPGALQRHILTGLWTWRAGGGPGASPGLCCPLDHSPAPGLLPSLQAPPMEEGTWSFWSLWPWLQVGDPSAMSQGEKGWGCSGDAHGTIMPAPSLDKDTQWHKEKVPEQF